jgi:hypothetical protein
MDIIHSSTTVGDLTTEDEAGLSTLTRVLGLWFQDPKWDHLATEDGHPYVHLSDASGDISLIIARDETGEFAIENAGVYQTPEITGPSVAMVALGLASHYATKWIGIGSLAVTLVLQAGGSI